MTPLLDLLTSTITPIAALVLAAKVASLVLLALFVVTGLPRLQRRAIGLVVARVRRWLGAAALTAAALSIGIALGGCSNPATRPTCATARQAAQTIAEAADTAARAYCSHTGGDVGGYQ